ncbi:hypothetical protein KIN20_017028 [Parelaphostrongylus tenuis]|uniref:Uncharacterized protein n=1 Tax=Parelaphostrongylus tenuis TaxID=148309 RepID=A0AAD5MML6_PARTN|nr:hypothetical protein KIN20_017028 [Parelaphostrongylus tenuis]
MAAARQPLQERHSINGNGTFSSHHRVENWQRANSSLCAAGTEFGMRRGYALPTPKQTPKNTTPMRSIEKGSLRAVLQQQRVEQQRNYVGPSIVAEDLYCLEELTPTHKD